jgi:hypothetical protein
LLAPVLQALHNSAFTGGLPKQLPGHAAFPTALHASVQWLLQESTCAAVAVGT